jgi:sulfatase maturation enzyme AslB (radical SAM superfamily)
VITENNQKKKVKSNGNNLWSINFTWFGGEPLSIPS